MFFKKKQPEFEIEKTESWGARVMLMDAQAQLYDVVELVETRRLAIEVYPKGPDKEIAEENLHIAKQGLTKAINKYNAAARAYNEALMKEADILPKTWHPTRLSAHQQVEFAVKSFYQRG